MIIDNLALTFLKGVGTRTANRILEHFGSAAAFFKADPDSCLSMGLQPSIVSRLRQFTDSSYAKAEQAIRWAEKFQVRILCRDDPEFPVPLTYCSDAPIVLYCKGSLDLRHRKGVAVVGTRKASHYGKEQTRQFIVGLKSDPAFIVSGLALGIDTQAHRSSLEAGLPTVAVLAHGLEQIYPEENTGLANEIINNGGAILSEMPLHTKITAGLFPRRNRIIAGLAEATVVAEASIKGGAMRTAYAADAYQRALFAVPGRNDSYYFEGCNYLIRTGKALLIQSADDIRRELGWQTGRKKESLTAPGFTPDFDQAKILAILESENQASGDLLQAQTGIPVSELLPILLRLEMAGAIRSLPGNRYEKS